MCVCVCVLVFFAEIKQPLNEISKNTSNNIDVGWLGAKTGALVIPGHFLFSSQHVPTHCDSLSLSYCQAGEPN